MARVNVDGHILYDTETGRLCLYLTDPSKLTQLIPQDVEVEITLPDRVAYSGFKALVRMTEAGVLELQEPATFFEALPVADVGAVYIEADIEAALKILVDRINALQDALIAANVLQSAVQLIQPDAPAAVAFATTGPPVITTDPAEFALYTTQEGPAEIAFECPDPVVVIS